MRPLAIIAVSLMAITPANAGNYCYRCYNGKTYYYPQKTTYAAPVVYSAPTYSAPTYSTPAPKVEVKNYIQPQAASSYKKPPMSDEDLAGEVGRRVSKYEAGLRALGGVGGYAKQYAQQAPAAYAPQQAQAAPQAVVPYNSGSTAYAVESQSIDVFGKDAVDKLAKLMDGQQRLAGQQADNGQLLAQGVNDQIGGLADGIKAQQAANDAARAENAATDRLHTMLSGMIQMADAMKPEPRANIQTHSQTPHSVSGPPSRPPTNPLPPPAAPPGVGAQSIGIQSARSLPVISEKCGKCHSGQYPKGGLSLDGSKKLTAGQFAATMKTIHEGKTASGSVMPPMDSGISLTQAERVQALQEVCRISP